MKRTIALICAFIMLLCCLTSCKKDKETSDTSGSETTTQSINNVKINGESITDWSVVYPDDYSNSEKYFAEQIQQKLSEISDYNVRLCSDKENVTEKVIVIKTAEQTGISVEGSVITLAGNGKAALAQLCSTVLTILSNAKTENGVIDIKITDDTPLEEFLTVMSFNLRFDLTEYEGISRADAVVAQIRDLSPVVFGVQEDTKQWCDLLDAKLTEYTAVHTSKPIGTNVSSQEYLTIYYRTDKLTLIESGTKWLSATPNLPTKFSESTIQRAMNYAVLESTDGEKLCFVNTHLEHTDSESTRATREKARQKQTAVLIEQTKKICEKYEGVASVTVGDFNCTNKETIHATIRDNGYEDCRLSAFEVKSQGTWNGAYYGDPLNKNSDILDYCYVSKNDFAICSYAVSVDKYNGMYTSDHFPIVIKLLFDNK